MCPQRFSVEYAQSIVSVVVLIIASGCSDYRESEGASAKARQFTHHLAPIFTDVVSSVDFTIPIENDTSRTLRFDVVSNSCSCTKSKLRKSDLSKGEKTVLDGQIALHRELGRKGVRIQLRDSDGPEWNYDVEMQCYKKMVLPLNGAVSFGEVKPMGIYKQVIPLTTFSPPGNPPVTFASAQCRDERIKVTVENAGSEVLADGVTSHRGAMTVELTAAPRADIESAVVIIGAREGNTESEHEIHVHWQLSTVFEVDPPRLFFPPSTVNAYPVERRAAVRRRDGQPFTITGMQNVDDAFSVRVVPDSGKCTSAEVIVTVATRPDRDVWSKLTLKTDSSDQESIYLPVSGLFKVRGHK